MCIIYMGHVMKTEGDENISFKWCKKKNNAENVYCYLEKIIYCALKLYIITYESMTLIYFDYNSYTVFSIDFCPVYNTGANTLDTVP